FSADADSRHANGTPHRSLEPGSNKERLRPYDDYEEEEESERWNSEKSWREAVAVRDEIVSYKTLGDKIIKFVSERGPQDVDKIPEFLRDEFGSVIKATSFKEGSWLNLVKALIRRGSHSNLRLNGNKIGLREHFDEFVPRDHQRDENYDLIAQEVHNLLLSAPGYKLPIQEILDRHVVSSLSSLLVIQNVYKGIFEWDISNGTLFCLKPGAFFKKKFEDDASSFRSGSLRNRSGEVPQIELCDLWMERTGGENFFFGVSFVLKEPCLKRKREFFQYEIDQFYSERWSDPVYEIDSFEEGLCCIIFENCPNHGKHYYRARVLRLKGAKLVVSLIDYSKILSFVHRENARKMEEEFLKVASFGVDITTEEFVIVPNKMEEIEKTFFDLRYLFLSTVESVYAKINFKQNTETYELSEVFIDQYFSVPSFFINKGLIECNSN
ncbi:unnamed protein product, partial [Enterobius vermicularis]|uniref:Tudor domain-containing protein n=1 Tax=Enterobius vermicularis TaxID=51028 RepID=A0A0N4VLP7_ENTVE